MTDAQAPARAVPAATVMLLRDDPAFEVLMVKRHDKTRTHGGALVFPGGKTHDDDLDPDWAAHADGWGDYDDTQRGLRIAAVREVFEEVGVLLARRADGGAIGADACPIEVRKAVDAGTTKFLDVVTGLDARIDLHAVVAFARWITPTITAHRFDTWFYVAHAPADQLGVCDGRETVDLEWVRPGEALRLWRAGERKVVFPTRTNLGLLGEAASAADAISRARSRPFISVQPSVEERPEGRVLVLPPDAGYGAVEVPVAMAG
ncbi:NUDIX hydrolase [Phenylobacterium sp.]|jgi:8-oxo-dGTP pyrophosphatase MutT (NUDIX family)|uniref:NUDIX hydrolase n=1 Tax=Phenylobacterium sp. TaxID=1871053 RepID=UPI002F41128B